MSQCLLPEVGVSSSEPQRPLSYLAAGVDIDAAETTVEEFKAVGRRTLRPEVLGGIGAFAGLFRMPDSYRDPVLVASADGVGTKLLIAGALGRHDTVGQDLVNHCIDDILTAGAEPLFFLDYLATNGLAQEERVALVSGIGEACARQGVALLGGETADMPDLYRPGDYDLAGFIIGVVERDGVIDGSRVAPGDVLLALPSTGLHTNGYSLVREAFGVGKGRGDAEDRAILEERYEELSGASLGEALLAVHRCYLPELRPLLPRLHGIAHITGSGIPGNLPRIFRDGIGARIDRASWTVPPLFRLIQERGRVTELEMFRTFNMGVGIILAVAPEEAGALLRELPDAWPIGEVIAAVAGEPLVRGLVD